jgi:hypothetical protein
MYYYALVGGYTKVLTKTLGVQNVKIVTYSLQYVPTRAGHQVKTNHKKCKKPQVKHVYRPVCKLRSKFSCTKSV